MGYRLRWTFQQMTQGDFQIGRTLVFILYGESSYNRASASCGFRIDR